MKYNANTNIFQFIASQNRREGPLETIESRPCYSRFPTASCSGKYPAEFWIFPEKETPWPLWAACPTALSLSK